MNAKLSHRTTVLGWTIAAGALGGVAANISVFGEPTVLAAFGMASWFKYLVIPVVLGALAAGIGVFVLTKADTTDLIRTFFFAAICGLAFPQIIENAKRSVSGEAANDAAARALEDSTRELQGLAAEPNADPAAITGVVERIRSLSARVDEPEPRQQAVLALQAAATTLTKPSDKATTVQLIKDIGSAAAAKKDYDTTARVLTALQTMAINAKFGAVQDQVAKAQGELILSVPEELRSGNDVVAKLQYRDQIQNN